MLINNRAKVNIQSYKDKDKDKDKDKSKRKSQMNRQAVVFSFTKVIQLFASKFLFKYSTHYYEKHLSKDDYIGLKLTSLPTYFDLYKANELVFNKKSYFNVLYKEEICNIYPYELFNQVYPNIDLNYELKSLLFTSPSTFPPNLSPSGLTILKIISKHQEMLRQTTNRKTQLQFILQSESKKDKDEVIFKSAIDTLKGKLIAKDSFCLANYSLSIVELRSSEKRRTISHSNGKDKDMLRHYTNAKIDNEEEEIGEIETFINQIESIEGDVALKAIIVKRKNNKKNDNSHSANHINANSNAIKDHLLITNLSSKNKKYNKDSRLRSNEGSKSMTRLMLQPTLRKFKSLNEFIETGKKVAITKEKKNALVQGIVNKYHQLQFYRKRSVNMTPNSIGHSTNLFCLETPYQKDDYLALKTRRLIDSIEKHSGSLRTFDQRVHILKQIHYPNIRRSTYLK